MDDKVDRLSEGRPSEWAGSGALRWDVAAFGCGELFAVEVESPELIKRAIDIIDEELHAVKRLVRQKHIPATSVGDDCLEREIDLKGPFDACVSSVDFSKHNVRQNRVVNLLKGIDFSIRQRRRRDGLRRTLESLSDRVGPGSIIVVADAFLYDILRTSLRNVPRVTVFRSGYGSSRQMSTQFLRKPSPDSFLYWLSTRSEDPEVGAIVLVGAEPFEPDVQAAQDSLSVDIFKVVPIETSPYWQTDHLPVAHSRSDLPKISIVTVSYNQSAFLERAIESVLQQEYPNLEYVIVDGGSTDGSVEIIDRYREHFHSVVIEPDNGQSDALNKGFRLTTGELMNWLCSDDLLEPNSLYRIAKTYSAHRPDVIVGGCIRIGMQREAELVRHHTSLVLGETIPLDPFDMLRFIGSWQRGHYFFQPEVFFSRRIWNAAGGYIKPHLYYAMDYDLWLRMGLAGARVRHISAFLGCSRVHAAQKTQENQHYLPQIEQILLEYKLLFERLLATVDSKHFA